MQRKLLWTVALAAAAIATGALAGSPKRFDLICNGAAVDADVGGKAFNFSQRINVDTTSEKFCTEGFCSVFTTATPTHFEYECKADNGYCHPESKSKDAQHVTYETFSFDWLTKAFKRSVLGVHGDPVSKSFRVDYTGVCTFGSFTGFPSKK
jgi:hypothetical protein